MAQNNLPPLPPGFVLGTGAAAPQGANLPALPPGFVLASSPAQSYSDRLQQRAADTTQRSSNVRRPPETTNSVGQGATSEQLEAFREGEQPQRDGLFENAMAGVNKATYAILGAPVDFASNAYNWGAIGVNALRGAPLTEATIPTDRPGGRQWIEERFTDIGVHDPDTVVTETPWDQLARSTGEVIPATLTGNAINTGMKRLGNIVPQAMTAAGDMLFGAGSGARELATNVVVNAGAEAGSRAAQMLTPDNLDPISGTVGAFGGGGVTAGILALPRAAQAGGNLIREAIAPMRREGQELLAGRQLREDASDPQAVINSLGEDATLVPGSQPTTGQQTGDMGILAMERVAERRPGGEVFNVRRAEQNAARLDAINNVQPTGAPEQVAQAVRARLTQLDQELADIETRAVQQAQSRSQQVGEGQSPQVAGEQMRNSVAQARAAKRQAEDALFKVVEEDGTLTLPLTNTRQQAARVREEITPLSERPDEVEASIYADLDAVQEQNIPFRTLNALRSRLNTAISEERMQRGRTAKFGRLSQIMKGVEQDLDNAIAGKVEQQTRAVQAGEMAEMDTMAAKVAAEVRRSLTQDKQRPGKSVERGLMDLPEADRPAFLALLEQKYRAAGDLEMLRAIRDYRKMLEGQPSTKTPSTD